jgi:hypothetical protein
MAPPTHTQPKKPRRRNLASVGVGVTALIAAPYAEELWLCAGRQGRGA